VTHWVPHPFWRGQTAFILGGGPSLTQEVVDRLKGRRVIATNEAGKLAPFADILLFSDHKWYRPNKEFVAQWPQAVVTCSVPAAQDMPHKVHLVSVENTRGFPPSGSGFIRNGRSSGHKAISLAVAMGARRAVLLGFDMRVVDGRSHFHGEYKRAPELYRDAFIPTFKGWCRDARRSGCEVLNATPGSALTEFPFTTLDEVLACDQS
jgi:hypothetical protein